MSDLANQKRLLSQDIESDILRYAHMTAEHDNACRAAIAEITRKRIELKRIEEIERLKSGGTLCKP